MPKPQFSQPYVTPEAVFTLLCTGCKQTRDLDTMPKQPLIERILERVLKSSIQTQPQAQALKGTRKPYHYTLISQTLKPLRTVIDPW